VLEALQQHDARLQEMESIRTSLPRKLAENQAALGELQRILDRNGVQAEKKDPAPKKP